MKTNIPRRNLSFGDMTDSAFLPAKGFIDDDQPVLSPMTELAVNLEMSSMSTPRRKLALSGSFNPTPERTSSITESLESGIDTESPALSECPDFESPMLEVMRARKLSGPSCNGSNSLRRQLARRSFSSPILPRKPLEALNFDEVQTAITTSTSANKKSKINNTLQLFDSNVENGEEKHSDLSLCEMSDQCPELEQSSSFQIKKRNYSGRSWSAPTISHESYDIYDSGSSSSCFSCDDGFFDELSNPASDNEKMSSSVPTNFMGLIKAPIVSSRKNSEEDKENLLPTELQTCDDGVFKKPVGIPLLRSRSCSLPVKRYSPATSPSSCSRRKRARKMYRSNSVYLVDPSVCPTEQRFDIPTRALQRSQSFDIKHAKPPSVDITSLLDIDDKNLIGDKTKEYCLPTVPSKHPDLKGIGPETLAQLINGDYNDIVEEYVIIDSRYPYEFEGGHIQCALNIFEKEELVKRFLKNPPTTSTDKRQILIFHCEFSSKRGPAMCRFLRNKDRNQNNYPHLYYPEMYLLEGGYKEFFAQKKEFCKPQTYREMLDPDYQQDLKLFSKKSKSWSEDKSQRRRVGLRY